MPVDISKINRIYLMGIGGVAMGNLAGLLKAIGKVVRGSDRQLYSPMKEYLEGLGIDLKMGFSPQNLDPVPDLVIVGNVITRDNPEAQEMMRREIPYMSLPEALREFFLKGREVIVIAGTHGKTTTTALVGWILKYAGFEPGVFLGGISRDFNSGFYFGRGRYFVIEGDEYDTAFFDKRPKFLHYNPRYLGVTTIEFDHGDIYKNLEDIKNAFRKLIELIPSDGCVLYNNSSGTVKDVIRYSRATTVALYEGGEWNYKVKWIKNGITEFVVFKNGEEFGEFRWEKFGEHNIKNALLAIAICDRLGVKLRELQDGIESFRGVKRRQEEVGEINGVLLIDDFAHHPTEVKETIRAVKMRYPGRRLWALFEPRSNTSRRNFFQELYPEAFSEAEITIISGVYNKERIGEKERLDPEKIAEKIKKKGKKADYIEDVDRIVSFVLKGIKRGDVVLVMSNGDFGGVVKKLASALRENNP